MQATKQTIVPVPAEFRPTELHRYPSDNENPFEEWLFKNLLPEEIEGDRMYLPIMFTGYLKNNGYGQDKRAIQRLQNYINTLDSNKKYFICHQYDDGPLIDLSRLDIKCFSMAGSPRDYGLPLISQPHNYTFTDTHKTIFCSFVGRLTHPIREKGLAKLSTGGIRNGRQYYITTANHSLKDYCKVLSKSIFSLCFRGYSANSFRIQESLEYDAIPVWISDVFLPIHNLNFNEFGVLIEEKDIDNIHTILEAIPDSEIKRKQSALNGIYKRFFSYEANKSIILEQLKTEQG